MTRCFLLPCFGSCSKRRRNHHHHLHSHSVNANPTGTTSLAVAEAAIQPTRQKTVVQESIDWIAESKIENEVKSYNKAQVTSTEKVIKNTDQQGKAATQEKDNNEEEECSDSLFSLSLGSGKRKPVSTVQNGDAEVNSSPMQLATNHVSAKVEENTMLLEEKPNPPNEEESSSAKELINKLDENNQEKEKARPLNHPISEYRYPDCSSDDDTDFDGDQEEDYSSESLFSLSNDYRKRISSAEKVENEVSSSSLTLIPAAHIITQEQEEESDQGNNNIPQVSSLLNPIENHTQGKKKKLLNPTLNNDKENINLVDNDIPISPEPSLKLSNHKARQNRKEKEKEIGVDTSLSSWLVESETTPKAKSITSINFMEEGEHEHTPRGTRGSPFSHEDRPILGALTIEEINKYSMSATTSSRRSRSQSPDETPIIGTVGSYWSHTGQKRMSSKFNNSNSTGKDGKLNWSCTKIKTRLEPAFEASVDEI